MRYIKEITLLFILALSALQVVAQDINPDKKLLYKVVGGDSLYLHVFEPEVSKNPTAVIVYFFGGGWVGGNPNQFYQQSEYLASRGMLAISAEYRIKNTHGTTPFDCVEDAKSAVRWIRTHAKELNINPDMVIAGGGSAGGHIAVCTAVIEGLDNSYEDLSVSSVPNAVVGYNPVFDTTEKGYGHKKVKGRETEISPCHQVQKNMPPMLLFHGKEDTTVPYENAQRFYNKMLEAGNDCELVSFEHVGHGFFNGHFFRKQGDLYFNQCMYDTDVFLTRLGYLKGKPTLKRNIKQLACIGDSNTEKKYPEYLQEALGQSYQVENYGKGAATLINGSYFPYFNTPQYKASVKFNADIALIILGTNDANPKWCLDKNRKTDFKGTPQDEFKERYIDLINAYKKRNPGVKIFVMTPMPVWPEKKPNHPTIKGRKEQLNKWVIPTIKEIAKEQDLVLIDVHHLMRKGAKYSKDGVHLNDKGYSLLAKKIAKEIRCRVYDELKLLHG